MRKAGLSLALALVTGCGGAAAVPHAHAPGPSRGSAQAAPQSVARSSLPATLAGYDAQRLAWRACGNGFACTRLYVPFDYSRPSWRRFSLPVIELRAPHPVGALVINPGGPGGSGVQYALGARGEFTPAVLGKFDIVGFDPRGTGGSAPAVHCMTGRQLDTYFQTNDAPANPTALAGLVAESRLYASECERRSGALLPYVGTRDAARDIDVLRAALGEDRLTYLGKSYGTYLGTWYAQLFPRRVRALVLDGAVDPSLTGISLDIAQAQGFEVAFRTFATWCAGRSNCPFHSPNAAVGAVRGLLARATSHPLQNLTADGQVADGALLLNGIASALYSKSLWPTLSSALGEAFSGDGTVLVDLANSLMERSPSGQYSNLADVDTAVNCIDRSWPKSLASWRSAASAAAQSAPLFGAPLVWGSLTCAYWPVASAGLARVSAAGAPPVLVVGNLRDPATPYRWAQALARQLASGVLLGWNGDGHTAYMEGSSCINAAVDGYLVSLRVPRSGMICRLPAPSREPG